MMHSFYRKGTDKVIVLHIADPDKTYLSPEWRPVAVKNFFKIELLTEMTKKNY